MVQITARALRQTLGDPPTVIVVSALKRAAKATFTESPLEAWGLSEIEGQTLRSTLRKGWYWGGESFTETLLQKLEGLKGGSMPVAKDFRSSDQARDHDLRDG